MDLCACMHFGGAVLVCVLTYLAKKKSLPCNNGGLQESQAASALWKFLAEPQPPLYAVFIALSCKQLTTMCAFKLKRENQ